MANAVNLELMNLIGRDVDSCEDLMWPVPGQLYPVIFSVEHIGPNYDDNPSIEILVGDRCLDNVFMDLRFLDLVGEKATPIASGLYSCTLEFVQDAWYDWESGGTEYDYGFNMSLLFMIDNNVYTYCQQVSANER